MNQRIEGTIVLDGLIEGKFSDGVETEEKLEGWVAFVRKSAGLSFSLEMSGNAFSLLPHNEPASAKNLGLDPQDAIRQLLEQLVEALPASDRKSVFSTLRSAEVRKNEEVQTLYAMQSDGTVKMESRTVEADTVAPPPTLTTKQKIVTGAVGLGIAAVVIAAIFFFFPGVRKKVGETLSPIAVEDVIVDASSFEAYFAVELKEVSRNTAMLIVKPTDAYPKDAAALDSAYAEAKKLSDRLVIEALARGYVNVECYNEEKVLYRWDSVPIPKAIVEVMQRRAKQATNDKANNGDNKTNADKKANAENETNGEEPKPLLIEVPIDVSSQRKYRVGKIVIGY